MGEATDIRKPDGKLGILMPGMGAVATTLVAGVELAKRDMAEPIGSLTQFGAIRLGKRTENRVPKIKEFGPYRGWGISSSAAGTLSPTTPTRPLS